MGAGEGGEGVVEERYVTLGGYTVQRYEALQGGGGCQVFRKKALRNTWMAPKRDQYSITSRWCTARR